MSFNIKKLDLFGFKLPFLYKKKYVYTSIKGMLLSVFFIISTIILVIFFFSSKVNKNKRSLYINKVRTDSIVIDSYLMILTDSSLIDDMFKNMNFSIQQIKSCVDRVNERPKTEGLTLPLPFMSNHDENNRNLNEEEEKDKERRGKREINNKENNEIIKIERINLKNCEFKGKKGRCTEIKGILSSIEELEYNFLKLKIENTLNFTEKDKVFLTFLLINRKDSGEFSVQFKKEVKLSNFFKKELEFELINVNLSQSTDSNRYLLKKNQFKIEENQKESWKFNENSKENQQNKTINMNLDEENEDFYENFNEIEVISAEKLEILSTNHEISPSFQQELEIDLKFNGITEFHITTNDYFFDLYDLLVLLGGIVFLYMIFLFFGLIINQNEFEKEVIFDTISIFEAKNKDKYNEEKGKIKENERKIQKMTDKSEILRRKLNKDDVISDSSYGETGFDNKRKVKDNNKTAFTYTMKKSNILNDVINKEEGEDKEIHDNHSKHSKYLAFSSYKSSKNHLISLKSESNDLKISSNKRINQSQSYISQSKINKHNQIVINEPVYRFVSMNKEKEKEKEKNLTKKERIVSSGDEIIHDFNEEEKRFQMKTREESSIRRMKRTEEGIFIINDNENEKKPEKNKEKDNKSLIKTRKNKENKYFPCFPPFSSSKNKKISNYIMSLYYKDYDIISYFKLRNEFEIMKFLILDNDQLNIYKYIKSDKKNIFTNGNTINESSLYDNDSVYYKVPSLISSLNKLNKDEKRSDFNEKLLFLYRKSIKSLIV